MTWFAGRTSSNTNNVTAFDLPYSYSYSISYRVAVTTHWESPTYSTSGTRTYGISIVDKSNTQVKIHYCTPTSYQTTFDALTIGY